MGKMKLNPEEFMLDKESTAGGIVEVVAEGIARTATPLANSHRDIKVAQYNTDRDMFNEAQHTLQVRCDTLSSIVGDACDLLKEITRAIGVVSYEKEITKQVQAQTKASIRAAEEQTKQTRIKEEEATAQKRIEVAGEIEKARLQLKDKLSEINNKKEQILSNEREFNNTLSDYENTIKYIMKQYDLLPDEDKNFENFIRFSDKLIAIMEQISNLYINSRSN